MYVETTLKLKKTIKQTKKMEKIDEFSFIVEPLRLINCLIDTYILPKSTIHFSLKHKITQNIKLPILKDNQRFLQSLICCVLPELL